MLSVVIPATDRPPTLERCAAAVEAALPPGGEVIVQRAPAGAGPARARNAGAARATGNVLVFVDADVVVEAGALERVERRFRADPGLAALFGSYDDRPEAPGAVSQFRNLLHHHVHSQGAGPAETFWAGLGAVRRDAFEAVGGFDAARYPRPAIEDVELGERLAQRGMRIELDPGVRGTHLKRWTLGSMARTDLALRGIPWTRLQLERRRRARSLNLAPRQLAAAGAAATAVAAAAGRRPGLAGAGAAAMVAANAPLYALIARRAGPLAALLAVPLHAVHHLTAIASVPLGAASFALSGRRRPTA